MTVPQPTSDTEEAAADRTPLPPAPPWVAGALTVGLALVAVTAALISGVASTRGDRLFVVVPLALMVAVAVGFLALTRFSAFVLLLLGIRPSIDLVKLSGDPTGVAGGTGVSRGVDPSSMLAVLFLAAALLWLAARVAEGTAVPPSGLSWALLAFGTTAYLSVVGSARPGASALEATRIVSVVIMFLVLEQLIRDERTLKVVLGACYAGMLYPLLYTLFGLATGNPPSETAGSFTRLTGPFNQSNTFSRYLAFMLIFGVALYPHLSRRARVPAAAAIVLSSVFLVMTLTRTGMLGAAIGVAIVALIEKRHTILVGMATFGVIALLVLPGVGARFGTVEDSSQLGASQPTGNTVDWRLRYWAEVLPLANQNPVTGIGLTMTQYGTAAQKQPHNDFLRAYVETGVVGFATFVTVVWALLRSGWVAVRATPRGSAGRAVSAGAFGCAAAFALSAAFANVMSNVVSLWYLFAFAAAAAAVRRWATGGDAPRS